MYVRDVEASNVPPWLRPLIAGLPGEAAPPRSYRVSELSDEVLAEALVNGFSLETKTRPSTTLAEKKEFLNSLWAMAKLMNKSLPRNSAWVEVDDSQTVFTLRVSPLRTDLPAPPDTESP